MNGSFRFARFHDQFLLTNDAGRFAFLPPEDFSRFVHHQLPHDSETWQRLQENFFCYDTDREVYLRSVMAAVRENHAHLFSPTSLFILAVTNRCNNACVYCQANGGAKCADLDIPTARKIIDRIAASPAKHLTIEFQGGEPLMNFPVLQEVVRYSREKLNGQDVRQKAAGILCGFQGFLTHNPAVLVEIDDSFDFSDTPQAVFSKMPKRWMLLFHHLKMFLKRRKTVTMI